MKFRVYKCTNCADTIIGMIFDNDYFNNIMLCPICGEPMDTADSSDRAELHQTMEQHNAEDDIEES